jgi:hypothetical protein
VKLPLTLFAELAAGACVAAGAAVSVAVVPELFAGFELFAAAVAFAVAVAAVAELDDDEADALAVVSAPATGAPPMLIALLDPN